MQTVGDRGLQRARLSRRSARAPDLP